MHIYMHVIQIKCVLGMDQACKVINVIQVNFVFSMNETYKAFAQPLALANVIQVNSSLKLVSEAWWE